MNNGSRGRGTTLPDDDRWCPKGLPWWLGDRQRYEHHLPVKVGAAHQQAAQDRGNAPYHNRQSTTRPPLANWVVPVCYPHTIPQQWSWLPLEDYIQHEFLNYKKNEYICDKDKLPRVHQLRPSVFIVRGFNLLLCFICFVSLFTLKLLLNSNHGISLAHGKLKSQFKLQHS